jgi:hypothetical protein
MSTFELINIIPAEYISDADRAALLSIVSTRGKYKGYFLATEPAEPERKIVWKAAMLQLAPTRVSIASMMMMSTEDQNELNRLDKVFSQFKTCFNACEPPMRWNLWSYHYDREVTLASILKEFKGESV